jgi:hypothetical protein
VLAFTLSAVTEIVLDLLLLMGPEHQIILVNPSQVVSMRTPRRHEHFGKGVRCLINTVDGKFIAVIQPCQEVKGLLRTP